MNVKKHKKTLGMCIVSIFFIFLYFLMLRGLWYENGNFFLTQTWSKNKQCIYED